MDNRRVLTTRRTRNPEKGSRMNTEKTARRRFLGRSLVGLGSMAYLGWRPASGWGRQESGTSVVGPTIDRAVRFLRPRQDAKGGWSTQREPGITALVVTALLRSGEVPPGDPMVTRAFRYLEGFIGAKGGLSE